MQLPTLVGNNRVYGGGGGGGGGIDGVTEKATKLFNYGKRVTYNSHKVVDDISVLQSEINNKLKLELSEFINAHGPVKSHVESNVLFEKKLHSDFENSANDVFFIKSRNINSGATYLQSVDDIDDFLLKFNDLATERIETLTSDGSSYYVKDISNICLSIYPANNLETGRYSPLPSKLLQRVKRKQNNYFVVPMNDDPYCVLYCLAIYLTEAIHCFKIGDEDLPTHFNKISKKQMASVSLRKYQLVFDKLIVFRMF